MKNKHINQLFAALTLKSEQKEKIFHNILVRGKDENEEYKNQVLARRFKLAGLTSVLMVFLTTSAFAAAYIGLDDMFMKYLNPVNYEQSEYLSNGAYVIDKQIKNEYGTLHIKQVIGDSNLTYIFMDFIAPEGTVLDAARYRFLDFDFPINQNYKSVGFEAINDGDRKDNKISLVMSIMTKNTIAGENVHFQLGNLQAADPLPGAFTTVIPGVWETDFKLDFKEYSTPYEVNENISMFGYDAMLKTVSVSPIAITLKVESSSMKEINEAAGPLRKKGANQHLDNYPITIHYQDGTSETSNLFNGLHLTEFNAHQLLTIKTFENVINDREIASIVFFNKEIPIEN